VSKHEKTVPLRPVGRPRGVATACEEAITVDESTNQPGRKAEDYSAHIKPGDAIETPDGELWVVNQVHEDVLLVVSAARGNDGRIYADAYDAVHTSVPREFAAKVADARQVRR
jgi:hypothetical protein